MTLREKYLECVKQASKPGKVLVSKSAIGPDVVALRDANGQVIGFSTVEYVPVTHPDVAKHLVSKSATKPETDPNAVFDSLFFGGPEVPTIGPGASKPHQTVVAKSVSNDVDDDPNDVLDLMVPDVYRHWPL